MFYTFPVLTRKDNQFEEMERLNPAKTLKDMNSYVRKLCFLVQDIEGWDDFPSREGKTVDGNSVNWTEDETSFQRRAMTFYAQGSEFRRELMDTHAKHALEARERVIYPAPVFCRLSSSELSSDGTPAEQRAGSPEESALSAVQTAES